MPPVPDKTIASSRLALLPNTTHSSAPTTTDTPMTIHGFARPVPRPGRLSEPWPRVGRDFPRTTRRRTMTAKGTTCPLASACQYRGTTVWPIPISSAPTSVQGSEWSPPTSAAGEGRDDDQGQRHRVKTAEEWRDEDAGGGRHETPEDPVHRGQDVRRPAKRRDRSLVLGQRQRRAPEIGPPREPPPEGRQQDRDPEQDQAIAGDRDPGDVPRDLRENGRHQLW